MGSLLIKISYLFFVCFLSGCSILSHYNELAVLNDVSKSQDEIDNYIKRQDRLFYVLQKDVAGGKIKVGMKKEEIFRRYGEPVLVKNVSEENSRFFGTEQLLYRLPMGYYSSPRIYLYFNSHSVLVGHERRDD